MMTLGFLGCGKMAGALVRGVLSAGVCKPSDILLRDVIAATQDTLAAETGAVVAAELSRLAGVDALLLCVKPGDALAALRELPLDGRLVISIAAGLSLETLASAAPGARLVRVMPNTPALVHKGASAYALGALATEGDAATAERIFGAVGTVCRVKEPLLDAVTGLSGSGPAYIYTVIEALADGGVLMGLPRDLALQLAAQTVTGAADMVLQTGQHPAVLRDMVTSPGGTTIAGLEAMEKNGTRASLIAAVRAATERAKQLGAK